MHRWQHVSGGRNDEHFQLNGGSDFMRNVLGL